MKMKKFMMAAVLAAVGLLAGRAGATDLTVQADGNGGGVFYTVHRQSYKSEDFTSYVTDKSSASYNSVLTIRFYCFAFPNCGYDFSGWATSKTGTPASGYTTPTLQLIGISAGSSKTYYPRFQQNDSIVKDIYLCVGDKVQLHFYDTSSSATWATRLNDGTGDAFWTSTSQKQGNGSTFVRSKDNSASSAFSIEITANTAGQTDTLVVRDTVFSTATSDGVRINKATATFYHYRIHVSAARTLQEWTDTTITATSPISYAWTVSDVNTDVLTVSSSAGSAAATSTTLSLHGVNYSSSASLFKVTNYDSSTSATGEKGVTYTYSTTVTEAPKFAHYAKMTAQVSGSGGKAYVSSASTESATSYTTSQTTAGPLSAQSKYESADVGSFYLWALADFGYKFTGWSKGSADAAITLTESHNTTAMTISSSATTESGAVTENYYAHFSNSGVTVKDIYLAVNDKVQLFYYHSDYGPFAARVNSTMLTSVSATSGSYATYARSAANTANVQSFSVTVTATKASGTGYDELTVQDHEGNVYHYRIHVTAARDLKLGQTATVTEQTFCDDQIWFSEIPSSASAYISSVSASPATETDEATITFRGKAVTTSAVTVQVANNGTSTATGPQGAIFTFSMTVSDPPTYTYYARVKTTVVDGSSSGVGCGWAYASRKRQEDSDIYQTTISSSEVGSTVIYEDAASAEVDGFYIFAFPNPGYRFVGWSVGSPDGEIVTTHAFSASDTSLSVTATSKTLSSPTEVIYYAHFERDDSVVRDITLAVGDTVRLSFANAAKCNWSLQVLYTNANKEVVVNLDDTTAHAAGYANYTRSNTTAPSDASTEFSMFVEATQRSGNDFDQLTIEDYAGNVYHYRIHVIDRRVIEQHTSAIFQAASFASKPWSRDGVNESDLTVSVEPTVVSTNQVNVHVTGVEKCTNSTFTVSNYASASTTGPLGATYTFGMNVVVPWPVEFCQGDEVVIYYHNTVAKNWYLLINGNRFEPNVAGNGSQMTVTLSAENPDTDTEILGIASTPGEGSGDLVIVTDGENFYPYRMAVRARRVLEVGESKTMTCSTVATSPWRIQETTASKKYLTTSFSPDENGGHSASVTITGKAPGKNVKIYVANFLRDQEEVNAQGAYYTIVTDVIGAYTHGVYMSMGTSVTWGEAYLDATASSTYTVTPAVSNLMTAAIASNNASTVFTTLTAPANVTPYKKALFTVTDQNGAEVVKYDVMSYGLMSMAVGQVAPGCLDGSTESYDVWSSDPDNFPVTTNVYAQLNSARIEAKAPGDYWMWATNPSDAVNWYVIRAQVYDETNRLVAVAVNGTTNLTVSSKTGLEAVWTISQDCEEVTASLDNTTTAADHVTLTVTGKESEGTHIVKVQNAFHHETIEVFVGAEAGQTVVKAGSLKFSSLNTVPLPGDAPAEDWTAFVSDSGVGKFSLQATSGSAGIAVEVYGITPGTGQVIVKTASTIYVYDVEVAKNDGKLAAVTVGVGYTLVTNLTDIAAELAGATLYATPDSMTATAYLSGNTLTIKGVQDGRTSLQLATSTYIYTMEIIVHERNILKYITLLSGEDGTSTSYSYTFDKLISFVNRATDRLTITQSGNTLTFTPVSGAEGIGGAVVEAFVDGIAESSTITYHVTIKKEESGYRVINYGDGYISYKDVDTVRWVGDDLVFVFTNVDKSGIFKLPDGFTARADILAVGGGGGGGSVAIGKGYGGGGGGAGGFASVTNKKMSAGVFGVMVGAGGLALSSEIGGGQSLQGSNGADSVLTNSFGYVIARGNGGGGGAAPSRTAYSGLEGGSGGGGSWSLDPDTGKYVPGRGGLGTSGQGCNGGTPIETNCGGGGGGAGGDGGDGQTSGPGKYSDISGVNTLYSYGGYGGRSDKTTQAADGQGPGYGGDGGNGGPGGNGGDGEVVVRFKKLVKNVLVPIPSTNDLITSRFQWEEGANYVPITYEGRSFRSSSDSHPYNWEDVLGPITGTTNVICTLEDGTNKVGVGYYNFYLSLNDGFAWEDGSSYGSTEKLRYRWVVCEKWEDIDADIAIQKTVWWSDKSNATIRVHSTASPETSGGGVPNVLYLGTLCGAHGLEDSVINAALNAVTEVGNVDCYLFNTTTSIGDNSSSADDPPAFVTNLLKGAKINCTYPGRDVWNQKDTTLASSSGNHGTMAGFYRKIYENISSANPKEYDYIIFSFDRARLAERFEGKLDCEEAVVNYLKPFYANEKVIWLVDNVPENCTSTTPNITQTPWFPCNLTYFSSWETLDKGVNHWSELTSANNYKICKDWVDSTDYAYYQYNALVGLMCPSNYPIDQVTYRNNATTSLNYTKIMATACPGIEHQCVYDDADTVAELIGNRVKVKPFNMYYKDKIVSPSEGLTIQDVVIKVCSVVDSDGNTSTNEEDWVALMHWSTGMAEDEFVYDDTTHATGIPGGSMAVNFTSNLVTAVFSNIDFKVYARYDTHVLDAEGKFQSSDGANYNEATGQYEKNPNEGTAYISMINELGVGIGVEGDAETEVPWRYTAYQIAGTAVNGSIYVNGTQYSTLSCAEGHDATVYYRGNGGYRLTAITVDGSSVQVDDEHATSYTFENLQADHTVKVVFTAYYGTVTPSGATYQYDGVAHVPEVVMEGWDASYETQLRFSLTAEGPYYTEEEFAEMYSTNREITCVGDHTVYCRVYAYQEGYGDTFDGKGWVWVDTRVVEAGTVTITKKPLVITANSFKLSATEAPNPGPLDQWRGVSVSGLVTGDTVNTNDTYLGWSCPTYQYAIGQYRIDPVYQTGITSYDVAGSNYVVYLRPGVVSVIRSPMIIGGITQFNGLDPEAVDAMTGVDRVEIVYNGESTNLVIDVQDPTGSEAANLIFKYSIDDGETWTSEMPTRLHVGTNKVWYAIDDGTDQNKALYFSVTNYNYLIVNPRPITFTADSATKAYDGTPLTAHGYSITAGSLASGDSLYTITVAGSQTDAGSSSNRVYGAYIICATAQLGDETRTGDYAITYVDGELTVTPGGMTIGEQEYTPGSQIVYPNTGVLDVDKIYDGLGTNIVVNVAVPEYGYQIYYSTNALNDPNLTWVEEYSFTEVGTYPVHFLVEADNYESITNLAYVTIRPLQLTVTVLDDFMRKGDADPEFQAIVTYTDSGEVVPQEVLSQLNFTIAPTNSAYKTEYGTYDLVASGDTLQGNYELNYVPGKLTVDNKIDILYELDGLLTEYDGNGHTVTATVTNGAPNPVIRYSLSPDGPWYDSPPSITNVTTGTYIYYSIESSADYRAVTNIAVVTVTPYAVTVTAEDKAKIYGEFDPEFTATMTDLVSADAGKTGLVVYEFIRAEGEVGGTYAITPVGAAQQNNYKITYVPGELTIHGYTNLWICDHEDAGSNCTFLAFKPTTAVGGPSVESISNLAEKGYLRVAVATNASELASTFSVPVPLRDPTARLDIDKGWVWVKLDVPLALDFAKLLIKVSIKRE